MRYIVAVEGQRSGDRRVLLPGSMHPDDNSIPVYDRGLGGIEDLVGRATDFYRNPETGELSFSIYIEDGFDEERLTHKHPHIYITDFDGRDVDDVLEIREGVIRGIFFTYDISNWSGRR